MRMALVSNPASGVNRREPSLRRRLREALGDDVLDLAPDGPEGWPAVAAALLDGGIDTVGVSGGDGTLHCLLTALAAQSTSPAWPAVALLRAGTMNTLAANLGLRGSPVSLARAVRGFAASDVPYLQVGPHVGFLFGVGVPVSFLRAYYEGRTGPLGAAALLARVVVGLPFGTRSTRAVVQRSALRVSADGAALDGASWLAVGAGTVPDLGLGFRPCPRTPRPGHLEAYGFSGSAWGIVANLPRLRLARPMQGAGCHQALAGALRIEADAPIAYMVDGDLHQGGTRLDVRVPGSVRFLRPPAARSLAPPSPDQPPDSA